MEPFNLLIDLEHNFMHLFTFPLLLAACFFLAYYISTGVGDNSDAILPQMFWLFLQKITNGTFKSTANKVAKEKHVYLNWNYEWTETYSAVLPLWETNM